ncbi:polysaccharide deacetylase family protein [Paenibacillus terrigena]|uniref:polysaccharide deacetylase family protein n=1 Tax=Paenibacillus terrigena TaxID=369333 RepID=UPI0028D29A91|nr:polysaccharide deacetylase family protein [Paenibacillus terrigena]
MLSYLPLLWTLTVGASIFQADSPFPVGLQEGPAKSRQYYEARGEIVWEVPMERKLVALTFDDGPDPRQTPEILKLLKQYEAKGTFFVMGKKVTAHPELLKRESDEGHEIANHTYNHLYFNTNVSSQKLGDEIDATSDAIMKVSGSRPHLFRPPGGFYNERMIKMAKEKGYLVILWSWHQDTKDWRSPGVSYIVRKVLNNVRGGDIILFHDSVEGSGRSQTVEALKIILPELKERGYKFVTVSQLIQNTKTIPAKK